jgi:hypothetical protein
MQWHAPHPILPLPGTTERWEALKRWLHELNRESGRVIAVEFRT